jgi:hypothetical protein
MGSQSSDHRQMNYYRELRAKYLARQTESKYMKAYYAKEIQRATVLMSFHALFVADSVNLPRRAIVAG